MAETRDGRAERREEIKLRLEYLKVAISLGVIGSLLFAGLQWQIANKSADSANKIASEAVYQRMASTWTDHLRILVDRPELRPYFEEAKELSNDDPRGQAILAVADVRLDVMDAILTYAAPRWNDEAITGWRNNFASAFKTSPALCTRLRGRESSYGLIVPIGRDACARAR